MTEVPWKGIQKSIIIINIPCEIWMSFLEIVTWDTYFEHRDFLLQKCPIIVTSLFPIISLGYISKLPFRNFFPVVIYRSVSVFYLRAIMRMQWYLQVSYVLKNHHKHNKLNISRSMGPNSMSVAFPILILPKSCIWRCVDLGRVFASDPKHQEVIQGNNLFGWSACPLMLSMSGTQGQKEWLAKKEINMEKRAKES